MNNTKLKINNEKLLSDDAVISIDKPEKTQTDQVFNEIFKGTDDPEEYILGNLRPAKSFSNSRNSVSSGILSIINSKENGKRLTLSQELMDKLNHPQKIQVSFNTKEMAICENISGCKNSFNVKVYHKKGLVYAANLVKEITEIFNLDFSDKTCITFHKVRYITAGDYTMALITIA